MTIDSTPTVISYQGDGVSTVFEIPFQFDVPSDLKVTRTDPSGNVSVLSSGFSVTGGGGNPGELTLTSALGVGYSLSILDDPAFTQPADYVSNDAFPAETHEHALDRCVRISKRIVQMIDASMRVVDGDPARGDGMIFPSVANRRGKFAIWEDSATAGLVPAVGLPVGTALTRLIIAQLMNIQTAAEESVGVVPDSFFFDVTPYADVRRYNNGFVPGASAAVNAGAIAKAASIGMDTIKLPPGFWDSNPFTLPAGVRIKGAGKRATQLNYAGSGVLATLGGTDSAMYYGCGLSDLAIILAHKDARAVLLQGTNGAQLSELYIEGALLASRTNIGVVVDGCNASSFFNHIDDVTCNHMANGFRLLTTGSERCTVQYFKNCESFGDNATYGASSGLRVDSGQGDGTTWNGGNLESNGAAVDMQPGAYGLTMTGTRFEGNTTDVTSNGGAGSKNCMFVGLETDVEYNVSDPTKLYTFVGCRVRGGGPWVNRFAASVLGTRAVLGFADNVTPDMQLSNEHTLTCTNNSAITMHAPTHVTAADGMLLRITVRNTSGGALGTLTWDSVYKMTAWTQPANGFSRSIQFRYDGTNWVEVGRTAADVPN